MTTPDGFPPLPASALQRLSDHLATGARRLIGVVGAPGAGKSSFAQALHAAFPEQTQIVPMDGFHLSNAELMRLGRAHRKGAPDTFDAAGFCALLQRLRSPSGNEVIYAPAFHREIEEAIAAAIAIHANMPLLIVEGNYLLLDQAPWTHAARCLDDSWFLDVDDHVRTQRLLERHQRFGRSLAEAQAWVAQTDEPNAIAIAASRSRAQWHISWGNP